MPGCLPEYRHGLDVAPEHTGMEMLAHTIRLFPHKLHGEGHFVAVLEKEGTVSKNYQGYCANGEEKSLAKGEAKAYLAGLQEFLGKVPEDYAGRLLTFGEQLYLMPEHMPATKRLRVLRPGLHLGTVKKNRLEPAHALALAISPQEACHSWNLSVDEARAYLAGQTFPAEGLVSDHGRWIQPRLGQTCGFCDEESLPEGAAEAALKEVHLIRLHYFRLFLFIR